MGEPQRDRLAAAALKVTYTYTSIEEFVRESCNDISLFGIFVKTNSPLKEGVALALNFQLDDGSPVIQGLGQVVWRREIAQSEDRPSGMGIKFLKLDPASRNTIERAVEARGLTPSRFDRLGEAAARATSERPVHKRTSTPTVTAAEDVFNLDKSLSLSLDPDPRGSWSVDAGPPRYSFTREKNLSIGNQEQEASDWSSEELDKLERAFSSPASTPEETAISLDEEKTTMSLDWDTDTSGSRPADTDSAPSSLRPESLEFAPDQVEETSDWSSEELDKLERAFSSPASAPQEAALPRDDQKTTVTQAPITAEPDIRKAVRALQPPPLPSVHDSSDREGTILPPLPQEGEGQREGAKTESAAAASISANFLEQIHVHQLEPISERIKVTTLRERLAQQPASVPLAVSPNHASAQRIKRLAELSMAEIAQSAIARPRGRGALDVSEVDEGGSNARLRSVRRAFAAILNVISWLLRVVWRLIATMVVGAAVAIRAAIRAVRAMPKQQRRALAISALLALLLVGGVRAYQVFAPKAWRAVMVWGGKTSRALMVAGAELNRSVEDLGSLVETLSEPEQATERQPTRYLLKIVTQPAAAAVTIASKHYITPCEVELAKPEGALRIHVRRNSYRSIQRRITAADFRREGNLLTYTLSVPLEKLPSNTTSRAKPCGPCDTALKVEAPAPPAPKVEAPPPKRKPLTFYLEPMPEVSKQHAPKNK